MRSQNQRGSGRRRGPRRNRRSGRQTEAAPKPQPKTFWQKVVSFFSGPAPETPSRSGGGAASRPINGGRKPSSKPQRKPEQVEVTSPKLYVGNLSFDATESDLFELFNGVGRVDNAEVVSHRHTQRSKGFAFVTMQSIEQARRAVDELHDKEFMGRKLVVSGAKTSDVARTATDSDN